MHFVIMVNCQYNGPKPKRYDWCIRRFKFISWLFRLWVREIEFKGKNFFLYFLRFSTTKTTQKRPSSSRIAVLLQLDSEQLGPIIIVLSYSSSLLIETFCIASQNFKIILAGRMVSKRALKSNIWCNTGFSVSFIWKRWSMLLVLKAWWKIEKGCSHFVAKCINPLAAWCRVHGVDKVL